MGLTLKDGIYLKIKDGSITATGLEYYSFTSKEVRIAMKPAELVTQRSIKLAVTLDLTIKGDSTKSIADNLKTIAYEAMKKLIVYKTNIIKVHETPFSDAIDS